MIACPGQYDQDVSDTLVASHRLADDVSWFEITELTSSAAVAFRPIAAPVEASPAFALAWHDDDMARIRLSSTVDAQLLTDARGTRSGLTDAALGRLSDARMRQICSALAIAVDCGA